MWDALLSQGAGVLTLRRALDDIIEKQDQAAQQVAAAKEASSENVQELMTRFEDVDNLQGELAQRTDALFERQENIIEVLADVAKNCLFIKQGMQRLLKAHNLKTTGAFTGSRSSHVATAVRCVSSIDGGVVEGSVADE